MTTSAERISSGLIGIAIARYASATASSGVPPKYGSIQIVAPELRKRKVGPPSAQRTGVGPTCACSSSSRKVRGQNATSRTDEAPATTRANRAHDQQHITYPTRGSVLASTIRFLKCRRG